MDNVLQKLKNTIHYQGGRVVVDTQGATCSPRDDSMETSVTDSGSQSCCILARFLVMKMSWRGLYRRIMAVRTEDGNAYYIETYHPETGALTNSWNCSDVINLKIAGEHAQEGGVIVMTLRHQQSTKDVKFACQERSGLLDSIYSALYKSDPTRFFTHFVNVPNGGVFPAYQFLPSEHGYAGGLEIFLRTSATGIEEVSHGGEETMIWKFMYASKPGVRFLGGDAPRDGFQSISLFSNTSISPKIYAVRNRKAFCDALCACARERMGIEIDVDTSTSHMSPVDMLDGLLTAEKAKERKQGISPVSEWEMTKLGDSHARILVITEQTFTERYSQSYGMSECRALSAIASIIRYADDEQLVGIEWGDGSKRDVFRSPRGGTDRDAFITSLLYAAQKAAKRPIEVLPSSLGMGDPLIRIHYHPLGTPAIFHDGITESISLKQLQDASVQFLAHAKDLSLESLSQGNGESICTMVQRVREFIATVPYSGLSKDTVVDHRVIDALSVFLPQLPPGYRKLGSLPLDQEKLALMALAALQRICCSSSAKAYYFGLGDSFRKIFVSLECDNDHVAVEAARLLLRFFMGTTHAEILSRPSWERDMIKTIDPMEYHQMTLASRMAKSICFMSDTRCSTVIATVKNRRVVSPLLGTVIMEIVVAVACFPMADTTDMATRETMIQEVSSLGRKLFSLFQDPRLPVYDGLSIVMRTLAEGGIKAAEPMRKAALQEGALLTHLRCALAIDGSANDIKSSRELVSLWCDGYSPALELLQRILPPGITSSLERRRPKWNRRSHIDNGSNNAQVPYDVSSEAGVDLHSTSNTNHDSQTVYSYLQGNWIAFWDQVDKDCNHAGLIWNETCRSELRHSLKAEEILLQLGRQKLLESESLSPSWNFGDFRVHYASLEPYIQVGNMYIELLVNSGDASVLEYIREPKEFISSAYRYFLSTNGSIESRHDTFSRTVDRQCLCLRAMSMVYSRFCSHIGQFADIEHIIKICDVSKSRKIRYYAMDLITAMVNPESFHDESVMKIAKENAILVAHHGGVQILCDAVATIHEVLHSHGQFNKDTKFITGNNVQIEPKIWYYMESSEVNFQEDQKQDVKATFEKKKKGPFKKRELRQFYKDGIICESSYISRIGMKTPLTLASIRELRWWCADGANPYPERDFALKALVALKQILVLCPGKDSESGIQLLPLPICHRILSQKSCISRVVQSTLTNDPNFVNMAFQVLTIFVEQNIEAMRTIYQTGVFYNALAYSGSDLVEPAKFLKVSHLQQKFQRSDGSSMDTLGKRSILGNFLPESLLFILESYGPEAFSSAITGDSESPEIIWTHAMRCQRLIPHLWNHIGDFTTLLKESWALTYDYYPCPPLMYEEIDGEIWCHRYYLKHLCNVSKYSNWNIVDHLELLQSVLGSWRKELAKVGTVGMTVSDAAKLLELDHEENISESDMKKAYRRLARKYHPDRNPSGRDQFEAIHEAYLRLHSVKEEVSGPRDWCILLYVKTQCLIFKKCSDELKEYKYAGYPLIKSSLSLADNDGNFGNILSKEFIPLLLSSVELCWLTCESSALNAEELVRCDGIDLLENIFSRCVSVASGQISPSDPIALVMENILKIFGIMSRFESSRCLLEMRKQLLRDALKCCKLEKALNVVHAAMMFLREVSSMQNAREILIVDKILLTIIPLLFGYDNTTGKASSKKEGESQSEFEFMGEAAASSHVQAERHKISIIACETLATLACEFESDSLLTLSLQALFTPAIARFLPEPDVFLNYITTFQENHLIIWNQGMKVKLLEHVEQLETLDSSEYLIEASKIRYANLVGVTYISGVYLQNFCSTPSLEGFEDVELCKDLVKTLHLLQNVSESDTRITLSKTESAILKPGNNIECLEGEVSAMMISRNTVLCLCGLQELLTLSPKLRGLLSTVASLEPLSVVLLQACEYLDPDPRFSDEKTPKDGHTFLSLEDLAWAGETCLSVLLTLSSNAKCLVAMASHNIPLMLSWMIQRPHNMKLLESSCNCIMHISEQNEFSAFCCQSGGIFYLLYFVIIQPHEALKKSEKELLVDMQQMCLHALIVACSNNLHGIKCVRALEKLLPRGIVNRLLLDEAKYSYEMLHSSTENPEVIWNSDMSKQLCEELRSICADARRCQLDSISSSRNARISWNLKEEFCMKYACLDGHEEIGGIYIDLLMENPGYAIRNPQSLFDAVMQTFIQSPEKNPDAYVTVVTMLLSQHPNLSDHGVSSGYLSKMVSVMRNVHLQDKESLGKSSIFLDCLKVVHGLSSSSLASDAMVKVHPPILETLIPALSGEHIMALTSLEVIKNSLCGSQTGKDALIKSALDLGLIPKLLDILDWRLDSNKSESDEGLSMLRYKCVEIINSMLEEGPHKISVHAVLQGNEVWGAYQNQKHDMFLPSGAQQSNTLVGLLEGSSDHSYMILSGETANADEENVISDDLIQEAMNTVENKEPLGENDE